MSNLYDIDYEVKAVELLPPDKRNNRMIAFVRSLLSPVQLLRDILIDSYGNGSTASDWVAGTYARGVLVRYNKSIYESLEDGNTANPADVTKWVLVQENFIGVLDRARFNGQKIILEYALNTWFFTTFRQPPLVSDIYIGNASALINPFIVGGAEANSSAVYANSSTEFIIDGYSFSVQYNFTIYFPVAVYTALSADAAAREKIVRSFVDKYVPVGIFYQIQTY